MLRIAMKFLAYLGAVIVLLGVLLVTFRPKAEVSKAQTPESPTAATSGTPTLDLAVAAPVVFDLVIQRGRLVTGPAVIQVRQGDEVIFRMICDSSDELHLHGYNLHLTLVPDKTTTLQFSAKQTGRFGYELHHAKAELGALEVYPR